MIISPFWAKGNMNVGELDHWFNRLTLSCNFISDLKHFLSQVFYLFLRLKSHELRTLHVSMHIFLILFHIWDKCLNLFQNLLLEGLLVKMRTWLIIKNMRNGLINDVRDLILIHSWLWRLKVRYHALALMLLSVWVQINKLIQPLHIKSLSLIILWHLWVDDHWRLKMKLLQKVLIKLNSPVLMQYLQGLSHKWAEFQRIKILMKRVKIWLQEPKQHNLLILKYDLLEHISTYRSLKTWRINLPFKHQIHQVS